MIHKEFWGILFLAFVAWVFIAGSPSGRIENFCRPMGWTGNIVTSLTALVLPDQQERVQGWFDNLEYGCRYATWRLFYQDEYNKWQEENNAEEGPGDGSGSAPGEGVEKQHGIIPATPDEKQFFEISSGSGQ